MDQQDIVLYDWLSFTTKDYSPEDLICAIGLSHVPWEIIKGAHGYRDRKYFGSISVHYNGRDDMGVWLEMSGQGCRTFETMSNLSWADLFSFIERNGCHMTRLDVAFDDHSGLFEMDEVKSDWDADNFVCRSRISDVQGRKDGGVPAWSFYFGSMKSDVLIRIYDKAKERHCAEGTHWNRIELQLRGDRATRFMKLNLSIGEAFSGVLLNYLRFVVPTDTDDNKWRWPMTDYWLRVLEVVTPISIYATPGTEYNLDRAMNYVFNQAGNAINAVMEIMGVPDFIHRLKTRETASNPKYENLIRQYKYRELMEETKPLFNGGLSDGVKE